MENNLFKKSVEGQEAAEKKEEIPRIQGLKEKFRTIMPENQEEDGEFINEVGDLLEKFGEKVPGKKRIVLSIISTVLKNKEAQGEISNRVREWLNSDKENSKDENVKNAIE